VAKHSGGRLADSRRVGSPDDLPWRSQSMHRIPVLPCRVSPTLVPSLHRSGVELDLNCPASSTELKRSSSRSYARSNSSLPCLSARSAQSRRCCNALVCAMIQRTGLSSRCCSSRTSGPEVPGSRCNGRNGRRWKSVWYVFLVTVGIYFGGCCMHVLARFNLRVL
jgi:hypothetical protein